MEIEAYNFAQVTDFLYRSSDPTDQDIHTLSKEYGIKTIIDFRTKVDEKEKEIAESLGMKYIRLPWSAHFHNIINVGYYLKVAEKFLKLINDDDLYPIHIHCKHGRERTGALVAIYRIANEGWTSVQALEEMKTFGYKPYLHYDLVLFLRKFEKAMLEMKENS